MLDIGWSEMAVIALVALVVIGPKDLPKAMKTVAFWVRKARKLASEFHSGIDQLVREAELEEARDAIRSASQMNVDRALENTIDPTGEVNKALTPPSDAEHDPISGDIDSPAAPPDAAEAPPQPEGDAPPPVPPAPSQQPGKAEPA
jgi:sec-independent protein translocase protein TatB